MTVVLGIATSLRFQSRNLPRFVVEHLHRNVTVLVMVLIAIHVASVVLDAFAPIGWAAAVIPFASPYRPIWLSLGALGLDLLLAVAITSWLRHRVGFKVWRFLHWSAYASWLVVLVHAFGTGTDTREGWALLVEGGCAAAVIIAIWFRIGAGWEQHTGVRIAALAATVVVPAGGRRAGSSPGRSHRTGRTGPGRRRPHRSAPRRDRRTDDRARGGGRRPGPWGRRACPGCCAVSARTGP